ncbi:MAG: hypothetical protein KC613_05285 [Myxococcales bacterium]|nr:hypothetical protein [Myxococcales bacterium]MCB9522776.1 hypothetical protein [Myxococcales bacterium]
MDARTRVQQALAGLDAWVTEHGWAGYDPYDLHHWRLQAPEALARVKLGGRSPLGLVERLGHRYPRTARQVLGLEKRIYPKGMGLFGDAYARWHALTGDPRHLRRAVEATRWLAEHPSAGYPGWGWGLPIDWRSRQLFPAGTPCGIVTVICGEAFTTLHRVTGDARWRDGELKVAQALTEGLNVDPVGEGAVCFSFTPLDHFHVHNPNVLIAAWLVELGQATDQPALVELGLKAGEYGLQDLTPEGYLTYWGSDQDRNGALDHYHTGFEIRGFHRLWQATGDPRYEAATRRFFAWYAEHFFGPDGAPWRNPDDPGLIDVHGAAEALYCPAQLAADLPEARALLEKAVHWIEDHLALSPGVYAYRRYLPPRRPWLDQSVYVRWGQAWMMRGLVAALEALA